MAVACPPPIGLGYLAGYLLKHRRDEIEVIDARRLRLKPEAVTQRLMAMKPDLVGISALSFEAKEAEELARKFKKALPSVTIVLGGPYPSSVYESALDEDAIDFAVVGEGEQTFLELINALDKNEPLDRISGLVFRKNGKAHLVGIRAPIPEIDTLEIAWQVLKPEMYFVSRLRTSENTLRKSARLLPIFTSRGCPYSCYFCHSIFGKKFRGRSAENVLSEIDYLVKTYGVEELEVIDDSFNLDLRRAKKILKGIAERNYRLWLSFPNGIRADLIDEEFLDLMKSAGTYRVDYAIESASKDRQIEIGKRLDLEKTRWVIEQTWKRRIISDGYFILGFPGETEEEMNQTIEYALKSKLQLASFFHLKPFPGTALAKKYNKSQQAVDEAQVSDYSTLTLNLSAVPDAKLRRIRKRAYRRFYFSPFRLWSNFLLAPKNFRTLRSVLDVVLLSFKDSVNY